MTFIKKVVFPFFIFGTLFLIPNIILAQECGNATTQFVVGCNKNPPNCTPIVLNQSYQCQEVAGVCSGYVNGWYCINDDGECKLVQAPDVLIPCGSGGEPGCTTTFPVILSVDWGNDSSDPVTVTWYPGEGGTRQGLYVGPNYHDVNAALNCTMGTCVYNNSFINNSITSMQLDRSLFNTVDGTLYYFKVRKFAGTCSKVSPTKASVSSCDFTISPNPIDVRETSSLISKVIAQRTFNTPTDVELRFSSNNSLIASVATPVDTTYRYETQVTGGASAGTATLTSNVYLNNVLDRTCQSDIVIDGTVVVGDIPWWRVIDGDVTTNGDIGSDVPSGEFT